MQKIKGYKKLDFFQIRNEEFEIKQYFKSMNLKDARTMFSLQMKMTKGIKSHFFSDKKYARDLWRCSSKCDKISTIEHVKICNQYQHLRENRDIENCDEDLVHFFQDIVKMFDDAQVDC